MLVTAEWRDFRPCPNCGFGVSTEEPVKTWIRGHQDLDSRKACLCLGDCDLWVLRYGTRSRGWLSRESMDLMLVEIKTNGAELNGAQRDLLMIVNDLIRTNAWKEQRINGRFVSGHVQNARQVYSWIAGKKVQVNCYGVHTLRLSGPTPDASEQILWDLDREIKEDQLVGLLRFDLHPDSLRPMERRSHKTTPTALESLFTEAELRSGGGAA